MSRVSMKLAPLISMIITVNLTQQELHSQLHSQLENHQVSHLENQLDNHQVNQQGNHLECLRPIQLQPGASRYTAEEVNMLRIRRLIMSAAKFVLQADSAKQQPLEIVSARNVELARMPIRPARLDVFGVRKALIQKDKEARNSALTETLVKA